MRLPVTGKNCGRIFGSGGRLNPGRGAGAGSIMGQRWQCASGPDVPGAPPRGG
jgi:hypothetical protein